MYVGNFGVVHKGSWTHSDKTVEVAIKTMKGHSYILLVVNLLKNSIFTFVELTSRNTVKDFIDECNLGNKFDHPNVLKIIGVSIDPKNSIPLMVMPYMHHGDVKSYLMLQRTLLENDQAVS